MVSGFRSWLIAALGCLTSAVCVADAPRATPLTLARAQDLAFAVDGVIERGWQIDAGGRYALVQSRTGTFATEPGGDTREARLYATLFEMTDGAYEQRWQIKDQVRDCPFDLTLDFSNEPMAVADADRDGRAEIWVSYRLACRSDVSPSDLKLIGYEGEQKLAVRGRSRIRTGDSHEGGDFQADAAVRATPAIEAFAATYWKRVRDE